MDKKEYINEVFKDIDDSVSTLLGKITGSKVEDFEVQKEIFLLAERVRRLKMIIAPRFEYVKPIDLEEVAKIMKRAKNNLHEKIWIDPLDERLRQITNKE